MRGLAGAGDHDLTAGLDDLVGRREHEIDPLLVHQPRDDAEDRTARQRQPELPADIIGIGALADPVAGAKGLRELRISSRVPALIDAVQDPGQLMGVRPDPQQAFHSAAEFGRGDLPRIGGADGGQMRRVDDAALQEGQLIVEFQRRRCGRRPPARRSVAASRAGTGPDRRGCGWSGWRAPWRRSRPDRPAPGRPASRWRGPRRLPNFCPACPRRAEPRPMQIGRSGCRCPASRGRSRRRRDCPAGHRAAGRAARKPAGRPASRRVRACRPASPPGPRIGRQSGYGVSCSTTSR